MQMPPFFTLLQGEELVHTAQPSWWGQSGLVTLGVALLPLGGIGALLLAWAWWRLRSDRIWVTNLRLVWQQGLLDRRIVEVRLQRIDAIVVEQTFKERMLDYGAVEVAAGNLGRIRVDAMATPMKLREAIQRAQGGHELRALR